MLKIFSLTEFAQTSVDCMTSFVVKSSKNVACRNGIVHSFCAFIHRSFADDNHATALKHARTAFQSVSIVAASFLVLHLRILVNQSRRQNDFDSVFVE